MIRFLIHPATVLALLASAVAVSAQRSPDATQPVGVAEIDITPRHPVHLINQLTPKESEGWHQRLRAKALAFVNPTLTNAQVLVVFDGIGVPPQLAREVQRRMRESPPRGLRANVTICATHDHCAPHLSGLLPDIYGDPLPPAHRARIDQYTHWLTTRIETVARLACAQARRRQVSWGVGKVRFAVNRRKVADGKWTGWGNDPDGRVDHSLPLLCIREPHGAVVATLVSYACHNTSIGGRDFDNAMSGDWVGYAQEAIEEAHPGSMALVTLGCGGESRPNAHGGLETARRFGSMIGNEVARLLKTELERLGESPQFRETRVRLPLGPPPGAEELRRIVKAGASARSRPAKARAQIAARLLRTIDRNKSPELAIPYPIQTWSFGSDFSIVFLSGEVVVDYSHLLKEKFGAALWPIAYANDLPGYIPSKRILNEGGYEADQYMAYYGRLQRLLPSTEYRVLEAVGKLLEN